MPEENEKINQEENTFSAEEVRQEETLQIAAGEVDTEEAAPVKELPPAAAAPQEEDPLLQKVESLPEEKIPDAFRKEDPPPPLPLSQSENKEEQTMLLPLEGLEEPAKEPKLLKEQAPVLSGSGQLPPRKAPSYIRKTITIPMECGNTLGELLAESRKRSGLTLENVRELTKIRQENIIAMENNQLEELPPPVFVAAYTRTLQELYCLDESSRERVTEALDKLLAQNQKDTAPISEEAQEVKNKLLKDISSTVKINVEEERKFRITAYCVLGGLVLFLILITILILFLIFGGKKDPAVTASEDVPPFRAENISTLIPAVVPEVQKMELPEKLPSAKNPGRRTGKNSRR